MQRYGFFLNLQTFPKKICEKVRFFSFFAVFRRIFRLNDAEKESELLNGVKNLECIHVYFLLYVLEILRYALDDINNDAFTVSLLINGFLASQQGVLHQ